MVKELAKKCLNCGHQVHNSKSCNGNGKSVVKLFGVNLLEKKSIKNKEVIQSNSVAIDAYNDSDDQILQREAAIESNRGVKKEKKWTKEEHQLFLTGMEKLGKGKWSEISREFVKTRTPIQVASHAQKHFLRQQASNDKRKRSSIFDMPLNQIAQDPQDSQVVPLIETTKTSLETSTSLVLTSNNTPAISPETVGPAKVSNGFPHVFLYDSPPVPVAIAYPINYHGIQQKLKDPCKWQSFLENKTMPSPSFVPYGYIPYTSGNFATRAPVSNITSPQSFTHNMFLSGLGTSSRV